METARERNDQEGPTRGSRTLAVCTTTAGRRLSTRTHQTSPRRGSASPLVFTVLRRQTASLIPAPGRLVVCDVPAMPIQVSLRLLAHPFSLQEPGQQYR